jgi:3-oxoacyl-[acyl-carrier protein] reductase
VTALLDAAIAAFESVNVMVNNAGITRDATMRKMTEQQFDDVITVHLRGCWNGTRHAAAIMRESGGGSIINMSSISGKVGFIGQTNYSAAKAGIVGLSKAAAKEVAHLGVRINVIQPGLIRTAMTEAMPQHVWEQRLAEVPMQRAGEPDEIASVALFYASDLSSYMTRTVAEVTGGRTCDAGTDRSITFTTRPRVAPSGSAAERGACLTCSRDFPTRRWSCNQLTRDVGRHQRLTGMRRTRVRGVDGVNTFRRTRRSRHVVSRAFAY